MTQPTHRPVVVLGAGRHGRNSADIFRWAGSTVLGFLDDTKQPGTDVVGVKIIGGFAMAHDGALLQSAAMHVAIGNPVVRKTLTEGLAARGAALASAIHPSAVISPYAVLEDGLFIAPFVRISPIARIGVGAIMDPFCT